MQYVFLDYTLITLSPWSQGWENGCVGLYRVTKGEFLAIKLKDDPGDLGCVLFEDSVYNYHGHKWSLVDLRINSMTE